MTRVGRRGEGGQPAVATPAHTDHGFRLMGGLEPIDGGEHRLHLVADHVSTQVVLVLL